MTMVNTKKMNLVDVMDLGIFDDEVQYKLIKTFLDNNNFFIENVNLIDPKYFTVKGCSLLVGIMMDFYASKNHLCKASELKDLINAHIRKVEDNMVAHEAFERIVNKTNVEGIETAKEISIDVLKALYMKTIFDETTSKLKTKGYKAETFDDMMEKLCKVNNACEINVYNGSDLIDLVFDYDVSERVSIGIPQLDEHLHGGLAKKSVNMLISPTGVGKTSITAAMGMQAALNGVKVLHFIFEERIEEMGQKFYANLTGKFTTDFQKSSPDRDANRKLIMSNKKWMDALTNNIRIERLKNGSTTAEDIENHIRHIINKGFKPDLVIIDYLSCIQSSSNRVLATTNEFQTLERTMKKLEQTSYELNLAILITQQTNREGIDERIEDKENLMPFVQGSYRSVQPCAVVMSLTRGKLQGDNITLHLGKCRGSERRKWCGTLNNGTCQLNLTENMPIEGIEEIVNQFEN